MDHLAEPLVLLLAGSTGSETTPCKGDQIIPNIQNNAQITGLHFMWFPTWAFKTLFVFILSGFWTQSHVWGLGLCKLTKHLYVWMNPRVKMQKQNGKMRNRRFSSRRSWCFLRGCYIWGVMRRQGYKHQIIP